MKRRINRLEEGEGGRDGRLLIFRQDFDNERLYHPHGREGEPMTKAEIRARAGDDDTVLFIVYDRNWRGT